MITDGHNHMKTRGRFIIKNRNEKILKVGRVRE